MILFLVAIMLAGGTAMLVRSWLAQQRTVEAEAGPCRHPLPQKSVLVAHSAITRGQILKPADLAWQPWPEAASVAPISRKEPKRSRISPAGWRATPLAPGEPMTEGKMVAPGGRGFLAAVLSPGMRAVSVPVTATSGISGFVFPGDQVDILIPETLPARAAARAMGSSTRLRRRCCTMFACSAVDQKLESKPGEACSAKRDARSDAEAGEEIAVASEMGKLSLSLRSLAASSTEEANANSSREPGTLDTEVSRLLGKPLKSKDNSEAERVTVLRGSGKSG